MTQIHLKTAYLDDDAILRKAKYADGSTALVADDVETGERLAKLTVSMIAYGSVPTDQEHVFVKDYGENEGVLQALLTAGVVGKPIRTLDAGFATDGVFECKLTDFAGIEEL